jgi:hypothetical protein
MRTDKEMMETLAKADGWSICSRNGRAYKGMLYMSNLVERELDDYLTSKDALTPIIDGLTKEELSNYCACLMDLTGYTPYGIAKATTRQMAEALCNVFANTQEEVSK